MSSPSFSLIIESANLSMAELDGLQDTLKNLSLDPMIAKAKEVLLVDSGDIPEDVLQKTLSSFSWLSLIRMPDGTGYEELKMAGARKAKGEIVVLADGDCIYSVGWLNSLLEPFSDPTVNIVGGHTEIDSSGFYGLGVMIAFSFSALSSNTSVYRTNRYHMNNVAFRKTVLDAVPIPTRQPCYRMTGLHAAELKLAGYAILKQPAAKAIHAPPNGFLHFAWRFILFGHDAIVVPKLIKRSVIQRSVDVDESRTFASMVRRWFVQCVLKAFESIKRKPLRIFELPFVMLVFWAAVFFQIVGAMGGLLASRKLLAAMPEKIRKASTSDPCFKF